MLVQAVVAPISFASACVLSPALSSSLVNSLSDHPPFPIVRSAPPSLAPRPSWMLATPALATPSSPRTKS